MSDIILNIENPVKLLTAGKYCADDVVIIPEGGIDLYAAINVVYPQGSVLTCSKVGGPSFTAENTSGFWTFAIPEAGVWKVESEQGTSYAFEEVTIDHEYQSERVDLEYALYLFKEGVGVNSEYAVKFGASGGSISTDRIVWSTNVGVGNSLNFQPSCDISDYSKLCFELKCGTRHADSATYNVIFGLSSHEVNGPNYIDGFVASTEKIWNTSRATYKLPITDISGSYYVLMSGYATTGEIYNVWLEK